MENDGNKRPTCFRAGGQDSWQVENFANGSVGYDVILE
jgi:hypothetical protein